MAEILAEEGLGIRLKRLGLKDTFAHCASNLYLMKKYGLDAGALVAAVGELTGKSVDIGDDWLAEFRLDHVHSAQKAEAL